MADELQQEGYGLDNYPLGGESDDEEQHLFGMVHCRNCGGDELELDESGEFFRYDKTDGKNRLVCVKCGPQDEFPVRDVVWGDHHEALVAAYDFALAEIEAERDELLRTAHRLASTPELHDAE